MRYIILSSVLFFIFGIVVSEVIILNLISNKEPYNDIAKPASVEACESKVNCDLNTCQSWFPSPYPNQAISEINLISLRDLKKSLTTSAEINYAYEGIISEIKLGSDTKSDKTFLSFAISKDNSEKTYFYFTNDFTKLKINNKVSDISNIKANTNTRLTVSYDAIKNYYKKVTIDQ